MANKIIDTVWDETPINITQEANFIWSIANKLRGSYMPDKYGDVIIPMTILRRFECALSATKDAVVAAYERNTALPQKALCRLSGFQFYCTSGFTLEKLCDDPDHFSQLLPLAFFDKKLCNFPTASQFGISSSGGYFLPHQSILQTIILL